MTATFRWSMLVGLGLVACGGAEPNVAPGPATGGTSSMPGVGGGGTAPTGTGGSGSGVQPMTGGTPATAGSGGTTGGSATATATAGSGGTTGGSAGGGTGGSAGGGGGSGKVLEVTAPKELLQRTSGGRAWHVDNRLPQLMGKLIVNVEVDNGNINDFAIKHGFHVYSAQIFHCEIAEQAGTYASKTTAFNGNCRLETFDGMDHGGGSGVTPANSIMGKVKAGLTDLAANFPQDGWGYFLDDAGNVRWEEVGLTGYSHGATSAARWAKKTKVWRVVSRSGPRDNLCGNGANMPFKTNCDAGVISAWLDEPSATPIENYFGLVGAGDGQYGDIMFAMDRMKYVGAPVNINQAAPPYNGSHRLFISGGHDDFTDRELWPALEVAWGTPPAINEYANAN